MAWTILSCSRTVIYSSPDHGTEYNYTSFMSQISMKCFSYSIRLHHNILCWRVQVQRISLEVLCEHAVRFFPPFLQFWHYFIWTAKFNYHSFYFFSYTYSEILLLPTVKTQSLSHCTKHWSGINWDSKAGVNLLNCQCTCIRICANTIYEANQDLSLAQRASKEEIIMHAKDLM
jgi:hypothetical protein